MQKVNQSRLAPWYDSQTRILKWASRKLERKWHSTSQYDFHLAWEDSLLNYKKALKKFQNLLLFIINRRK